MKMIIGLHGLAGAGKSTAAGILAADLGFEVVPFAGPLKRMAVEYGLTRQEMTEGKEQPFTRFLPIIDERKAQKMLIAMGIPLTDLCITPDKPLPYLGGKTARETRASLVRWFSMYADQMKTPRRFLQLIGTEWGRGMVCPSLWLNMWGMDCDEIATETGVSQVVADDVRFANEARHILDRGGVVVEIIRTDPNMPEKTGHASETRLPEDLISITIQNDGPEDVLAARIHGILDRYFAQEAI